MLARNRPTFAGLPVEGRHLTWLVPAMRPPRLRGHLPSAALVLLLSSCATSLATRQTARTLDPGHFSVDAAVGAEVPLGTLAQVAVAGEQQTQKLLAAVASQTPYAVTDQDKQDLISAGVALLLNPPSIDWEGGVRAGVFPNLDIGARYSVNAVRGDLKYRFFEKVDGDQRTDVAAGLAVSKYLFSSPIFDALEFVHLGEFSRWDIEVPVYASHEWGEYVRVYAAAKYLYSRTELDENLVATSAQATFLSGIDFQLSDTLHTHFIGATAGIQIGYRWVFLVAEVTGGYALGSVRVLGEDRSLSGVILLPALGVEVRL